MSEKFTDEEEQMHYESQESEQGDFEMDTEDFVKTDDDNFETNFHTEKDKRNLNELIEELEESTDEEFFPDENYNCDRNTVKFPTFYRELDRCSIGDRNGAILANALLTDLGMITDSNKTMVVDRNKIRRGRKNVRKTMVENHKVNQSTISYINFSYSFFLTLFLSSPLLITYFYLG